MESGVDFNLSAHNTGYGETNSLSPYISPRQLSSFIRRIPPKYVYESKIGTP
jgi:hypothetical protein